MADLYLWRMDDHILLETHWTTKDKMREMLEQYVIADMAEHKLTVLHPTKGGNGALPSLVGEDKHFPQTDLLLLQAKDFVEAVRHRTKPKVPAEDVREVLAAALRITDKLRAWRAAWK